MHLQPFNYFQCVCNFTISVFVVGQLVPLEFIFKFFVIKNIAHMNGMLRNDMKCDNFHRLDMASYMGAS